MGTYTRNGDQCCARRRGRLQCRDVLHGEVEDFAQNLHRKSRYWGQPVSLSLQLKNRSFESVYLGIYFSACNFPALYPSEMDFWRWASLVRHLLLASINSIRRRGVSARKDVYLGGVAAGDWQGTREVDVCRAKQAQSWLSSGSGIMWRNYDQRKVRAGTNHPVLW